MSAHGTMGSDTTQVDALGPPRTGAKPNTAGNRGWGNPYQLTGSEVVPMPKEDYGAAVPAYDEQKRSPNDGEYGEEDTLSYGMPYGEGRASVHNYKAMGWDGGSDTEVFETDLDPTEAGGADLLKDVGINVGGDAFAYDSYADAKADMEENGWSYEDTGLVRLQNGKKEAYVLFDPYIPDLKPMKQKEGSLKHAPAVDDFLVARSTPELHARLRAVIAPGASVDVRGLDYAVANDMLRSLEDTHRVFPDVTKSIRSISRGDAEYVAAVRERHGGAGSDLSWDGPLRAGRRGSTIGYTAAAMRERGWWFDGSVEGSINHELGHVADNVARAHNGWRTPGSDEHAARPTTFQGNSSNGLLPANYRHYMAEAGSQYGGTNTRETFAELFSVWRRTGNVPPAMEPFFFSVLHSLPGVAPKAKKAAPKTKARKADTRKAVTGIIVVDNATAIFPDGSTVSYNFYGPGTEDQVRQAAESDWARIQAIELAEQQPTQTPMPPDETGMTKAMTALTVAMAKAGLKTGAGGRLQPYGYHGLYTSGRVGAPVDYPVGTSVGTPMPVSGRKAESRRMWAARGTGPQGEFAGKVWAQRTVVATRKQVKGEWVVNKKTPSWATNGDPLGNSTNPLTKTAQTNLGKLGYLVPAAQWKKTRALVSARIKNARNATPGEIDKFKNLYARAKAGDHNAERQLRGPSYERRNNKNELLKEWGDGHTCACAHCGVRIGYAQLELDKMVPAVGYKLDNLLPSCGMCNISREGGGGMREPWRTVTTDLPRMMKTRRSVRIAEHRQVKSDDTNTKKVKKGDPVILGDVQQPVVTYTGAVMRNAYSDDNDRVVPIEVSGPLVIVDVISEETDQVLWTSMNIGGWSVNPVTIRQDGRPWGALQAG